MENPELNQYVVEYLTFANFPTTLECFEAELKAKQFANKFAAKSNLNKLKTENLPKLFDLLKKETTPLKKDDGSEKVSKDLTKQYNQVLQAARQIFEVAVNCLQLLHSFKEMTKSDSLTETFENYKIQLGKYHRVIINEGRPEGEEFMTEKVMQEHKTKLITQWKENNVEGITDVLLSLRVNALQISPELRKNLVFELIRNDIFLIAENGNLNFLLSILDIQNNHLRHAITSLVSVVCSAIKGVEYLMPKDNPAVVEKIIKILKDQENGNVTQRFCIAILQKCSGKESIVPVLVSNDMIYWIINLLNKSIAQKIHIFCLDFASATLANIIHSPSTVQSLQNNPEIAGQLIESLLRLIRENIPISTLLHLLITLSNLTKESFQAQIEECQFADRISDFVEHYSKINTADNEAFEIDKRTVLDLCAQMFHPKDPTTNNSDLLEQNELKPEYRVKEYENEQGELIFECFQDEVS